MVTLLFFVIGLVGLGARRKKPAVTAGFPVSERMMGFEPTTSTLARLRSTTELHPLFAYSASPFPGVAWKRGYYTHLCAGRKPFFAQNAFSVEKSVFSAFFSVWGD